MIVADTGVPLGAADADDADHARCARVLEEFRGDGVVPAPAVPECSWQIEQHLGPQAEARFLRLITVGALHVADPTVADHARCAALIEQYADLGLGLVDAGVVTVAENLGVATIATSNRRGFLVVRPRHVAAFDLAPAP